MKKDCLLSLKRKEKKEKNNIALFQGKGGARSLQYIYFMY